MSRRISFVLGVLAFCLLLSLASPVIALAKSTSYLPHSVSADALTTKATGTLTYLRSGHKVAVPSKSHVKLYRYNKVRGRWVWSLRSTLHTGSGGRFTVTLPSGYRYQLRYAGDRTRRSITATLRITYTKVTTVIEGDVNDGSVPAADGVQFNAGMADVPYSGHFLTDGSGLITGYNETAGSGVNETIPSSINGVTITGIADSSNYTSLPGFTKLSGSLTIPMGITNIGNYAFQGTHLTSVTIPGTVASIGRWAFYNCTGLTSVTLSSGLTNIGDYAFYGCSGLTSVTIPATITSFGCQVFQSCTGLTSVTFSPGLTTIGNYAFFDCTGLTGKLTIPTSVTSIGTYAFGRCAHLTSVVIPASVTSFGTDAFYGCTGLASVTFSSGLTNIGSSAFYGCTGLTNVTIPKSVTGVDVYAFGECTNLTVRRPVAKTIWTDGYLGCKAVITY